MDQISMKHTRVRRLRTTNATARMKSNRKATVGRKSSMRACFFYLTTLGLDFL
jgi:hypothetical protein